MSQILPGVMCESADALSKLTLPDGSSRSSSKAATKADLEIKAHGNCVEMNGVSGTLVAMRVNTSIISVDAGSGKDRKIYYVPNIDFSLHAQSLAALQANSANVGLPASCLPGGQEKATLNATLRSARFTPESGQSYRYRFLAFPKAVCVPDDFGGVVISSVASFKGSIDTTRVPDGTQVTVTGEIGAIDAGEQPLSLDFIADRLSRL